MKLNLQDEVERIRAENRRRDREIAPDFYALHRPANLFIHHGQERALLRALHTAGMVPLQDRRILDVGCGLGKWLDVFEDFDARRQNLAGIEIDEGRAAACADRIPGADIRAGDASELPWSDAQFDIVFQSTVFTSVLDHNMRHAIAGEMLRVLKPQGAILWYDFHVNNPRNPHVRGVRRAEIKSLFPGCRTTLRSTTLAPPIARRLVAYSWTLCTVLEGLRVFNTHYFGVLRRSE